MKKIVLFICVGMLSMSLPAMATPVDTYSFKTPAATDGGTALRLLAVAGAPVETGPSLDTRGGKKSAFPLAPSTVSPGAGSTSMLITEAMTAPSYSDGSGPLPGADGIGDGDSRVLISEPSVMWLLLAGMLGLVRRR